MITMHYTKRCKHGVVVSTCRCAAPEKKVIIVPCPPECASASKTEGDAAAPKPEARAPRPVLTPEERRLDARFARYERLVDSVLAALRVECVDDSLALRAVDALIDRSRAQFAVSRAYVRNYKDREDGER